MECKLIKISDKLSSSLRPIKGALDLYKKEDFKENTLKILKEIIGVSSLSEDSSINYVYNFGGANNTIASIVDKWADSKNIYSLNKQLEIEITDEIKNDVLSKVKDSLEELEDYVTSKNPQWETNNGMLDFTNIDNLLDNSPGIISRFEFLLDQAVSSSTYIHYNKDINIVRGIVPKMHKFVTNNLKLNENISALKARWWLSMLKTAKLTTDNKEYQLFINEDGTWKLNNSIFVKGKSNIKGVDGKTEIILYDEVVRRVKEGFEKVISNRRMTGENKSRIIDSYINMMMLMNFDNFLLDKYSSLINVNPDSSGTFGLPNNGNFKYSTNNFSAANKTWADDSSFGEDVSSHQSKIFELTCSKIPFLHLVVTNGEEKAVAFNTFLRTEYVNSVGAILNSISTSIKIKNIKTGQGHSIQEWFSNIGKHKLTAKQIYNEESWTFKNFLESLKKDYSIHQDIESKIDFIHSIYTFLYDQNSGIHIDYLTEIATNPKEAKNIINLESLIFNQWRNVGKQVYHIGSTDGKSRTVDVLQMDTAITEDLANIYSSLLRSWSNRTSEINDHPFWKDKKTDSFIGFIKEFGNLNLFRAYEYMSKKYTSEFTDEEMKIIKEVFKEQPTGLEVNENGDLEKTKMDAENWISEVRQNMAVASDKIKQFDIIELIKKRRRDEPHNVVTTTKDSNKNNIPSMGVGNLASHFHSVIQEAKNEVTDVSTNAVLDSFRNFDVLLEVESDKGAMDFNKISAEDNLELAVSSLFFGNYINTGEILTQPWNLSDKSKILAARNNYNVLKKTLLASKVDKTFNSSVLIDSFLESQKSYFTSVQSDILDFYKKVFGLSSVENIEKYLELNTIESIKKIIEDYNDKQIESDKVEFIEEYHYSKYKDGKYSLNQALKQEIRIWTTDNLAKHYITYIEEMFLNNVNFDFDLKTLGILGKNKKRLTSYKLIKERIMKNDENNSFSHFTDDDFETIMDKEGKYIKSINLKKFTIDSNGKTALSEPLRMYLWTRNLINGALTHVSVRGHYIHPVKSKLNKLAKLPNNVSGLSYEEVKPIFEETFKEDDERMIAFFKRMVGLGGSINRIKQGGVDGVPVEMNSAQFEDPSESVFNVNGTSDNQKIWDGGIFLIPFAGHNIRKASVGNKLGRVIKPLMLSIKGKNTSFLKCAMFTIDNEMILNSMGSEYDLENMMKLALEPYKFDSPVLISDKGMILELYADLLPNIKVRYKGEYATISEINLGANKHEYIIKYKLNNGDIVDKLVTIDNFYSLWKVFGGADVKVVSDDGLVKSNISIELINSIIDYHAIKGDTSFRDKMTHFIIPRQGIKNGLSNINQINRLLNTNQEKWSVAKLNTDYFGFQLNASYDVDASDTNDITQVLAALAEENTSKEQAENVYSTIAKIIQASLSELDLHENKLKNITKDFLKTLRKSVGVDDAKTLLENLETLEEKFDIPFSDRSMFKKYISSVMTAINKELIKNKVTGAGFISNPAAGIIKIYEDSRGKTYLTDDLINIWEKLENKPVLEIDGLSEDAIIKEQIKYVLGTENFLPKKLISINQVNPLDTIDIYDENDTFIKRLPLNSVEDYYSFLNDYNDSYKFYKIYSTSRNLKPSEDTFSYIDRSNITLETINEHKITEDLEVLKVRKGELGIPNSEILETSQLIKLLNPEISDETLNILSYSMTVNSVKFNNGFNLDITKKKFEFEQLIKGKKTGEEKLDSLHTNKFFEELEDYLIKHNTRYVKITDKNVKFELFNHYVKMLLKRNWELMYRRKRFTNYIPGSGYFEKNLQFSDGEFDNLDYGLNDLKVYKNTIDIFNYSFKDFENIASKIYKSQFNIGNRNHADIDVNFFEDMISNTLNRKIYKEYDVLYSNIYDKNKTVQILILKNLPNKASFETKEVKPDNQYLITSDGNLEKYYIGKDGVGVYKPIANRVNVNSRDGYKLDALGKRTYKLSDNFKGVDGEYLIFKDKSNKEIIISNSTDLKGFTEQNEEYFGMLDIWHGKEFIKEVYDKIISGTKNYNFRKYLEIRRNVITSNAKEPTKEIAKIKQNFLNIRGKEMYNSWKMSLISIWSRIPAQAGQSFKSGKTVAYMHDDENSVYVSHFQVWLEGSDFDIDKIYNISFDVENGILVGWSPYFDLKSTENTNTSFELPLPNGIKYTKSNEELKDNTIVIDVDQLIVDKALLLKENLDLREKVYVLNLLNEEQKKLNEQYGKEVNYEIKTINNQIFTYIRNHNSFKKGFNNFKLYNMIKVSRSTKNRVSSTNPVTFGDYRNLKKDKEIYLNPYDPNAVYKQQENNAVGKDVIGIVATSIKSYFSLITYFNKVYSDPNFDVNSLGYFNRQYKIGDKVRSVQNISGLNLDKIKTTVLQDILRTTLSANKYQKIGGGEFTQEELDTYIEQLESVEDPAIKLSALLSAATDNAKELLLADINAGVDLAGVHVFLIIMGFNEIDIAKYMTSDLIMDIKHNIASKFLHKESNDYGPDFKLLELTLDKMSRKSKKGYGLEVIKNKKELVKRFFEDQNNSELFKVFNENKDSKQDSKDFKFGFTSILTESNSKKELFEKINNSISEYKKIHPRFNEANLLNLLTDLFNREENDVFKEVNKAKEIEKEEFELQNFKNIYFHAKEFVSLGSELSINQGVKQTLEEIYKVARRKASILNRQQTSFFKLNNINRSDIDRIVLSYNALSTWSMLEDGPKDDYVKIINKLLDTTYDLSLRTSKDIGVINITNRIEEIKNKINKKLSFSLFDAIVKDKPYLDKNKVNDILLKVESEQLITKGLDYIRYFQDSNYRDLVKEYYNLIKFTVNVFDVVEKSDHFREMINAFNKGNELLESELLGYSFISELLPQILDIGVYNQELTPYSILKKIKNGGKAGGTTILDKVILDRSQDTLMELLLIDWLNGLNFTLDFTNFIMDNKKTNAVKTLKNKKKLDENKEEDMRVLDQENPGDAFIIDFKSDYGKAKFIYLMERYIIPTIKQDTYINSGETVTSDNGFLKNYIHKQYAGFNMKKTRKFYESGLTSDAIDIESGVADLMENEELVITARKNNESNVLNSIKLADLLSIYDKIINLKRAGGNRSTKFLSALERDRDGLSSDFLRFQSKKESSRKEYIQEILDRAISRDGIDLEGKKNYRESLFLSLFGSNYKGTRSYLYKDATKEDEQKIYKKISNQYFRLVQSVETDFVYTPGEREVKNRDIKIAENGITDGSVTIQIECAK